MSGAISINCDYCVLSACLQQHQINYQCHGVRMFTICPKMTNTEFIQQNIVADRVHKMDVLMSLFNPKDQSQMLR